jgi:hypothetical protein
MRHRNPLDNWNDVKSERGIRVVITVMAGVFDRLHIAVAPRPEPVPRCAKGPACLPLEHQVLVH